MSGPGRWDIEIVAGLRFDETYLYQELVGDPPAPASPPIPINLLGWTGHLSLYESEDEAPWLTLDGDASNPLGLVDVNGPGGSVRVVITEAGTSLLATSCSYDLWLLGPQLQGSPKEPFLTGRARVRRPRLA